MEYMKAAAARHQHSTVESHATKQGQLALVTFSTPAKTFLEVMKAAIPMENMANLTPPKIIGAVLEALSAPCAKLLANHTALQVCHTCHAYSMHVVASTMVAILTKCEHHLHQDSPWLLT
jgi:hypothetical protein